MFFFLASDYRTACQVIVFILCFTEMMFYHFLFSLVIKQNFGLSCVVLNKLYAENDTLSTVYLFEVDFLSAPVVRLTWPAVVFFHPDVAVVLRHAGL